MKINPTLTALLTRSEGPARDFLQTLSPGQRLQGKVVDLPAPGTARLQIGLIELLAQTKTQLSPGQTLELQVKQLKPLPELKILNPPPERPPRDLVLQQSLPKQIPLREMVRELQLLLRPAADTAGSSPRPSTQSPAVAAAAPTTARAGPLPRPSAGSIPTGDGRAVRPDVSPASPGGGNATTASLRPTGIGTTAPAGGSAPPSGSNPSPTGGLPTTIAVPPGPVSAAAPSATDAAPPRPAGPGAPLPGPETAPNATAPAPRPADSSGATAARPADPNSSALSSPAPGRTPAPLPAGANPSGATAAVTDPLRPAGPPAPPIEPLPKSVQQAVAQLLRPAPQALQINAAQIQQQLRESGLFLEQQLARGAIPKTDYKLDLLRLVQVLVTTRTPPGPSSTAGPATPAAAPDSAPLPGRRPTTAPLSPPELHLPSPPTPATAPPPGNLTGGLTEQLLRLLTGAGRRPASGGQSTTNPGHAAAATTSAAAGATSDPRPRAEQLLQSLQAGRDPRRGGREAARATEPAQQPSSAVPRALTERLLQLVEGGLARIQTHQAASLTQAEDGRQAWQFELPLNRGQERDEVLIRLEQERGQSTGAEQSRWTATLRFAFDNLGSVEARLMLEGERLSSTFWCERAETERRFAGRFPELEQGLHKVGLEIGRLSAVQGAPPNPLDLPKPPTGMLDTHV